MMIEATWLGGPLDGTRLCVPRPCDVSYPHPTEWHHDDVLGEWPDGWVEVRCHMINTEHGYVIVWHEP